MEMFKMKTTRRRAVTLVELIVAIAIMTVVMGAVLPIFAGLRKSWDVKAANDEYLQNARVLADHLNRNISKAVQVTNVSGPSDLDGYIELQIADGNNVRYEIGTNNNVEFGLIGSLYELAGPVSQLQFTCYDGNDFVNPITDVNSIRYVHVQYTLETSSVVSQTRSFETSAFLRVGTIDGMDSEPVETFASGLALRDRLQWGGFITAFIDSYHSSQGSYSPAAAGDEAIVTVNDTGNNTIEMWGFAKIRGDAYIGPGGDVETDIRTWGFSDITGTEGVLAEEVDIPDVSAPTGPPFDGDDEDDYYMYGGTQTINTDRYFKRLELWGSSTLQISGNVTILVDKSFHIGGSSELEILPGSTLKLYVKKSVGVWNYAKLNESTEEPWRLQIYLIGNNNAYEMASDTIAYAVVHNPTGKFYLWNNSVFYGKARANRCEGGGQMHIDLDSDFY